MAWSPEAAKRLEQDRDFQDLFNDPGSPVAKELLSLETVALDPNSDPRVAHDAVCRRAGILKVLLSVRGTIEAAAVQQEAAAAKLERLPRRGYTWRNP